MSEPPSLLRAGRPLRLFPDPEPGATESARGLFCYAIGHYGYDGTVMLVSCLDDMVVVRFGDWNGRPVAGPSMPTVGSKIPELVQLMLAAGIQQVQLYITADGRLVDAQFSLNKWASPGMLRDLFGTIFTTQEIVGNVILDDKTLADLAAGTSPFDGDLILKPIRFRMCIPATGDVGQPLYFETKA